MTIINKALVRVALALAAEFPFPARRDLTFNLPNGTWECCERLFCQIRRARLRGWHLAAQALETDLRHSVSSVHSELAAIITELSTVRSLKSVATSHDTYADLIALAKEFSDLKYDARARWLSVTTEPIELEGRYLGPFEIRLDWACLARSDRTAYRCIARDPHPANGRDNITHPHVRDEVLCEGEARAAIRHALAQGRLLDFFTIVANLLRNYNPESPFAELALWHGCQCSDCGATVEREESFTCQNCNEMVCDECEVRCSGCDYSHCTSCTSACRDCREHYCSSCLRHCQACRAAVCPSCLHENERCANCHEYDESETEADCDSPATQIAGQPHGLGEAAVSA